jgi:hypothetical protein
MIRKDTFRTINNLSLAVAELRPDLLDKSEVTKPENMRGKKFGKPATDLG